MSERSGRLYEAGKTGGKLYRVYLNGVEQRDVFVCHTGEGWIEVAQRNSRGQMFLVDGREIARERRYGLVQVEALN